MLNQLELALCNIRSQLKKMTLGSSFQRKEYIMNESGEFTQDSNGNDLCQITTIQGYIQNVSLVHDSLAAMLEELNISTSALGIKYMGSKVLKSTPIAAPYPVTYMNNRQCFIDTVQQNFLVMCFLSRMTPQSEKIEGWQKFGVVDIMEDIRTLLEGYIVTPGATPLKWTSDQIPVDVGIPNSTQGKKNGAVIYGKTFSHIVYMRPADAYIGLDTNVPDSMTLNPVLTVKGPDYLGEHGDPMPGPDIRLHTNVIKDIVNTVEQPEQIRPLGVSGETDKEIE